MECLKLDDFDQIILDNITISNKRALNNYLIALNQNI